MSLSPDDLAALRRQLTSTFLDVAAAALVFYNWIVSLNREKQFIWNKKIATITIVYLCNQYAQMILQVTTLIQVFGPQNPVACKTVQWGFQASLTTVAFLSIASFSALRVWAISGKKWILSALVLALGLVPAATNLFLNSIGVVVGMIPLPSPYGGCDWLIPVSDHLDIILALTTRASAVACDALVLIVTWYQTYQIRKLARQAGIKSRLTDLLLRDGTLYFGVLLVMNTLQMIFDFPFLAGTSAADDFVSALNLPITSILVSNFILNLRSIDHLEVPTHWTDTFKSNLDFAGAPALPMSTIMTTTSTTTSTNPRPVEKNGDQGKWGQDFAYDARVESNSNRTSGTSQALFSDNTIVEEIVWTETSLVPADSAPRSR